MRIDVTHLDQVNSFEASLVLGMGKTEIDFRMELLNLSRRFSSIADLGRTIYVNTD